MWESTLLGKCIRGSACLRIPFSHSCFHTAHHSLSPSVSWWSQQGPLTCLSVLWVGPSRAMGAVSQTSNINSRMGSSSAPAPARPRTFGLFLWCFWLQLIGAEVHPTSYLNESWVVHLLIPQTEPVLCVPTAAQKVNSSKIELRIILLQGLEVYYPSTNPCTGPKPQGEILSRYNWADLCSSETHNSKS